MTQVLKNSQQLIFEAPLFGVLYIDGIMLFIPHAEIDMVEPQISLGSAADQGGSIATHCIDEIEYEIFCLDRGMQLAIPDKDICNCILLRNEQYQFGLLCEQLATTPREAIQLRRVPVPMSHRKSPVTAFAFTPEGKLGFVTTVDALYHHFQGLKGMTEVSHLTQER